MEKHYLLEKIVLLTTVALILFGCARGEEFAIIETEQAQQTNQYPKFVKATAATSQFTEEDKIKLLAELKADKQKAQNISFSETAVKTQKSPSANNIRREIEEVLKRIKQSDASE